MDLKRYTKLFNYGYLLSKYEPKILKSLIDTTEDVADINEPLKAGRLQFKKEKLRTKIKGLQNLPDMEIDKDIEPDI